MSPLFNMVTDIIVFLSWAGIRERNVISNNQNKNRIEKPTETESKFVRLQLNSEINF